MKFSDKDRMWMVRAEGGTLYDAFRQESLVALGWVDLVDVPLDAPKETWLRHFAERRPDLKRGTMDAGVSQVLRFVREVRIGDFVVTYNPSTRVYAVGRVTGELVRDGDAKDGGRGFWRPVQWLFEVQRDSLPVGAKNSLGSTLSLFRLPDDVARAVCAAESGTDAGADFGGALDSRNASDEADAARFAREDVEARAAESIKDRLSRLDGYEMQSLVAGILRAMGYKTRESRPGPDRGIDILASPDGLGFESPRIAVEVKHRSGQVDAPTIRSFLGGRHAEDRGLFVSTGGFTKDARYEADRAKLPMMLWDLDDVVRYLSEHYERLDQPAMQLVPLRRIYWPL